jgi:hypothetical protein
MSQYKLKSLKEHSEQINESVLLTLLIPIIAVVAGKLVGYTIGHFAGPQIKKSMDALVKSRFADKAHDSDIKKLYDIIQSDYPEIKDALDKDDEIKLSSTMKSAGLDKDDEEEINKLINKLRDYHNSL